MGSIKSLIGLLVLGMVLFNGLAYRHARAFFNYVEEGGELPRLESLDRGQKMQMLVTGIRLPKPRAHLHPQQMGLPSRDLALPGRDGMSLAAWRISALHPVATVIMFHGYNSEKSGLLLEAGLFYQLGCEVILVDFPGAGDSPGTEVSLGMHEAEDVASVYRWARENIPGRPIILYGHSMGGAAVLRAMALMDVAPDAAVIESVFDTLLNAIRNRFSLLSVPATPGAEALLFWGSVQLGANGFSHQPVRYAERVKVPVMLVHGKLDNRASWEGAVDIQEHLGGYGRLLLLDRAGHVNPSAFDRETWMNEVSLFIQESLFR